MPRFLIVDDDAQDREWITEALAQPNHSIHACQNGTQAIEFYRRERADLVFCDLMMPGIDGLSVLDAMKGIDPWATVVMVTGHSSVDAATHAIRLGAYDFVEKPFTFSQIQQVATRALDHRKQLKELTLLQGAPGRPTDLPARLMELEQLKTDFLSFVMEELRAPLRLLKQILVLIRSGFYAGPWPEGAKRQFLNQMSRIELLLSRTLQGSAALFLDHEQRVEVEEFHLGEAFKNILEEARGRSQEKHLIWKTQLPETPLKGLTDSKKVLSIASELLDNAIRFTPPEGAVTFRVSPTADGFQMEVADTGCGMDAEDQRRIVSASGQNCGLGLTLVRHYLDLLRGTLQVTAAPGQGSALRVNVPWWEKSSSLRP